MFVKFVIAHSLKNGNFELIIWFFSSLVCLKLLLLTVSYFSLLNGSIPSRKKISTFLDSKMKTIVLIYALLGELATHIINFFFGWNLSDLRRYTSLDYRKTCPCDCVSVLLPLSSNECSFFAFNSDKKYWFSQLQFVISVSCKTERTWCRKCFLFLKLKNTSSQSASSLSLRWKY